MLGNNAKPMLKNIFKHFGRKPPPVVRRPIVSLIDIKGRIGAEQGSISLDSLSSCIDFAFSGPKPDAILLRINCGGGSPAQAEMIYRRIRILADLLSIPVIASVEDAATSAGFWIALAADQIIAQESSLIGSIGIVSYQFGLDKLLEKLGIDRRILASGPDKAGSDPFSPMTERSRELLAAIQADIHETFKAVVMSRRGARLQVPIDGISLGTTWSGKTAIKLGLIDEIQDLRAYLSIRFRAIPEMRIYQGTSHAVVESKVPAVSRLANIFNGIINQNMSQSSQAFHGLE